MFYVKKCFTICVSQIFYYTFLQYTLIILLMILIIHL